MESLERHWFERVHRFGPRQNLIGLTCHPVEPRSDVPAVIFLNSGIIHRVGANRIYVRMARALASKGIPSLRFDLGGVGDSIASTGVSRTLLERNVGDIDAAIEAAARWFDCPRLILAGLCSGADHTVRAMSRDHRVVGMVLLDLNAYPTRRFHLERLRAGMWKLATWKSVVTGRHPALRSVLERRGVTEGKATETESGAWEILSDVVLGPEVMRGHFERAIRRHVQTLAIFTAGLEFQYNYRDQFLDMLPGLAWGRTLRLEYFSDSDHTFSRDRDRERLERVLLDWILTNDFEGTGVGEAHSAPRSTAE